MILAAGFGKRMLPLTNTNPKPLLRVADKPLIEYHLEALAAAGVHDVVINVAHLGEKIKASLGDGHRWQLSIQYSTENTPLETAGGIAHALPLLGDEPFLVVNGDVWTDLELTPLLSKSLGSSLGHLVLVDNPEHHPEGDFSIDDNGWLIKKCEPAYTFSGISIIHPKLISDYSERRDCFPLGEVFHATLTKKPLLKAEYYTGRWCDVGTIDRLQRLDAALRGEQP